MTALARLTRAELRKLATTRSYLFTLALVVALDVIIVVANAYNAGKNGNPALGTTGGADDLLKFAGVSSLAMLILGIVASGGEYRYRTIIPATLITPRRGAQVAAKTIALVIAGVVLSGLAFGLGLATAVAELRAHGIHHLPPATGRMLADAVIATVLFGVIGMALGYLTRSTIAAVAGAVGWVLFVELAILRTLAPQLAKWLITGTDYTLTSPPGGSSAANLPPATAAAVLAAYTAVLLIAGWQVVLRRDVA